MQDDTTMKKDGERKYASNHNNYLIDLLHSRGGGALSGCWCVDGSGCLSLLIFINIKTETIK